MLSKGLVGIVLPVGTIGLYVLLRRDWAFLKSLKILKGGALFLLIAAPWFVAVSLANPEFARFFFIQEHFERFTTQVHQRYGPPWYFLPILAAGLLPWLLPALAAWWRSLRKPALDAQFLFALWALVVLAFFSASSSKLPSYILPMAPMLALLAGRYLAEGERSLFIVQAGLMAVIGFVAAIALPGRGGPQYAVYVPWLAAAGSVAALMSVGALAFVARSGVAVVSLALAGLAATQLSLVGHGSIAPRFSAGGLIESLEPRPDPEAPVFAVDIYDHTLPWYLRRTVTMVHYRDELGQAVDWEPEKFLPDVPAFARAWSAAPAAYAFIAVGDFERLRRDLPMQPLARDPRYVFVRKP